MNILVWGVQKDGNPVIMAFVSSWRFTNSSLPSLQRRLSTCSLNVRLPGRTCSWICFFVIYWGVCVFWDGFKFFTYAIVRILLLEVHHNHWNDVGFWSRTASRWWGVHICSDISCKRLFLYLWYVLVAALYTRERERERCKHISLGKRDFYHGGLGFRLRYDSKLRPICREMFFNPSFYVTCIISPKEIKVFFVIYWTACQSVALQNRQLHQSSNMTLASSGDLVWVI